MKNKLSLLLIALMLFLSCKKEPDSALINIEYSNTFFLKYEEIGIAEAVDFIFSTNSSLKENSKDEIEVLKRQLVSTSSLLGNFMGYELIANRNVGSSLQLLSYLVKYEKQTLRFTFVYYKPDKRWVIQHFSFDGNLIEELEESARVYLLNIYDENK